MANLWILKSMQAGHLCVFLIERTLTAIFSYFVRFSLKLLEIFVLKFSFLDKIYKFF